MALDILHLTGFTAIRIFLKNVIREGDKKEAGCEIFVKKEQECGIRAVFSLPPSLPDPVHIAPSGYPANRSSVYF